VRLPRVWLATIRSVGTLTSASGPWRLRKWLIMVGVMLAGVCVCLAISRAQVARLPVPALRGAASTGTPICRGTIVSIDIDDAALSDKLHRDDSLWVVTVQPGRDPSGGAPRREMRFTMHSPSMMGFRRVGERVEVYCDDRGWVWATPYPSGTGPVIVPK
jgi:hypothetical protein